MNYPSDVIINIPNFEFENNLFRFKMRDLNIWEFIRFEVSYSIAGKLSEGVNSEDFSISNKNFIARLKELFLAIIYLPHTIFLILKNYKKIDVIIFNKGRYSLIDQRLVDTHSYYLASTLSKESKVLILDDNHYPNNPLNRNYCVECIGTKSIHVLSRIFSYFYFINRKEQKISEKISNLLEEEFNVKINLRTIIKNNFFYQIALSKSYKTIFSILRNNQMICVDNGNYKGIFLAAHKLKIIVSDYQHSVISRLYILYNYHKDIKSENIKQTVPDSILTWSPFWDSQMRIPVGKKAIGYKYFDIAKREYALDIEDYNYCKNIYFISPVIRQQKIKLYFIALEIAKKLKDFQIYFKLRPEDYENYDSIFPTNKVI